ncbi:MAG TPA: hypothetical protein VI008_05405 [Rubrobacter sp.]|jgi:hypothetical protein
MAGVIILTFVGQVINRAGGIPVPVEGQRVGGRNLTHSLPPEASYGIMNLNT